MEELHSTLTTYEMKIDVEDGPSTKEVDFEATRKTRNKELKVEGTPNDDPYVEENFIKKVKKGT